MPFFTIITATHNAASTLPRLLESLSSQTCQDFNWIVQDGASSDDTMNIVERFRDRLPEVLSHSSEDSGIYDAWNKAIDRWRNRLGEWVLFLGADDMLASKNVLYRVQRKILNCASEKDFASGHILFVDNATEKITGRQEGRAKNFSLRYRQMPLPHSALFTRRHFFVPLCFDTRFYISGDYDFILRNWTWENQLCELDILVTKMGNSGISSSSSFLEKMQKEDFAAIKKQSVIYAYNYFFLKRIENIKKYFRYFLLGMPLGCRLYAKYKKLRNLS